MPRYTTITNGITYFNEIHLIKALVNLMRQLKITAITDARVNSLRDIFNTKVDLNFSRSPFYRCKFHARSVNFQRSLPFLF